MTSPTLELEEPAKRRWEWDGGRWMVVAGALGLTAIIGAGDFVTGVDTPFTILYLVPIALGSWFLGRAFGLVLTVLSTASIIVSLVHEHLTTISVVWNAVGSIALFAVASVTLDRLRRYVDNERMERGMALEQLRHAERLNVIGTLAAGVAHELGTPLGVIEGCTEILADESSSERALRRTEMILGQIEKISTIVQKLLDFGHRGGAQREALDLRVLASSTIEMLSSTARQRDCAIDLEEGTSPCVEGDLAEIEQVLSNLILNALQSGSRTVHVRVATVERDHQQLASLQVEDDGRGIAAEHLPRIFDPFFTTKGVGEGTGLGLSVAYGIVRDHHGTIEVESELQHGSRFTVLLPRCECSASIGRSRRTRAAQAVHDVVV